MHCNDFYQLLSCKLFDKLEFMESIMMKKAELILANFDARIPKIEIKTKNTASKFIISSKMYDDETGEKISVKILFDEVAAIWGTI